MLKDVMEPIKEGMNASHQYFDSGTIYITPDHSINIKIYLHSHIFQYPPFRDMLNYDSCAFISKLYKSIQKSTLPQSFSNWNFCSHHTFFHMPNKKQSCSEGEIRLFSVFSITFLH